jgi:hypothetical protein
MKAIAPSEMPPVPEEWARWRRSLRRGSVFHLIDYLGTSACRNVTLERHTSEGPQGLGHMQFWGVCPRCYRKAGLTAPNH